MSLVHDDIRATGCIVHSTVVKARNGRRLDGLQVSSADGLLFFKKKRLRMTENSKTPRDLSQSLGDTLEDGKSMH